MNLLCFARFKIEVYIHSPFADGSVTVTSQQLGGETAIVVSKSIMIFIISFHFVSRLTTGIIPKSLQPLQVTVVVSKSVIPKSVFDPFACRAPLTSCPITNRAHFRFRSRFSLALYILPVQT